MTAPPQSIDELRARAAAIEGMSLAALALREGESWQGTPGSLLRSKGKAGQLLERALGACAGSQPRPDFTHLGVELKTLPVDASGRVRESTFVCSCPVLDVEHAEWVGSKVREKLAHVLFVPLIAGPEVRVGRALFWRPSEEQEAILRADFDDLIGAIALGHIESLSARVGRWLQLRPKAAHGRVRTRAYGLDGEPLHTMPRGFYLRARVTAALLANPCFDQA